MLDTEICVSVIKSYPAKLRERFNRLAEQRAISSITLGELCDGAKKSARRLENRQAVEQVGARLEALPRPPWPGRYRSGHWS